jgi:hypothetical protein
LDKDILTIADLSGRRKEDPDLDVSKDLKTSAQRRKGDQGWPERRIPENP